MRLDNLIVEIEGSKIGWAEVLPFKAYNPLEYEHNNISIEIEIIEGKGNFILDKYNKRQNLIVVFIAKDNVKYTYNVIVARLEIQRHPSKVTYMLGCYLLEEIKMSDE